MQRAYFDALRNQAPIVQGARCTVAAPDSGVFSAVSLFAIEGSHQADASGTTTFSGGMYSGGYQYNTLRWVQQDRVVYLIRLDKAHAYADISVLDAVETAMNARPGGNVQGRAQSAKPSQLRGVLQRGEWECCTFGQAPTGPIGRWVEVENMTCPEIVVSGTHYTIRFENQLPNVQPNGLVVFTGVRTQSTTVPWGTHVEVRPTASPQRAALAAANRARSQAAPS